MKYDVIRLSNAEGRWVLCKKDGIVYFLEYENGWEEFNALDSLWSTEKKQIKKLRFDKNILEAMECLRAKDDHAELCLLCENL